jgi:hypothetical protein
MNNNSNSPPATTALCKSINGRPNLADVNDFRVRAIANGYRLVRVHTCGKAPVSQGWQHGEASELLLQVTDATASTGMICTGLRVVDVDVDDPEIVGFVTGVVHDCLPSGGLIRRRPGSPRYAIVFRAQGEPAKRSVKGDAGKIEILGAGQQLVVDGIHPSGTRLTWDNDRSPTTVAAGDLPVVSEAQIDELLKNCAAILGAAPVTSQGNFQPRSDLAGIAMTANDDELSAGIDRGHWFDGLTPSRKRELVQTCLDWIDNGQNDPRDRWLSVLFAVADAEVKGCPDARDLALQWSRRGAGWTSEGDFDTAWDSFKTGPTTIATLIYVARQAGADLSPWQKAPALGSAQGNSFGQSRAAPTTDPQLEAPSFADPYAEFVGPKFPMPILPAVLADFVEAEHKSMGVDRSALAMASLSAVGAALTRETKVQVGDGWYERPILWVALVGDPSTMKSPVIVKTTKPLFKFDTDQDAIWRIKKSVYDQQVAAGVKNLAYPTKPPRCIVQDATPEKTAEILARDPAGSLLVQDELAGWMGSFDRYGSGGSSRAFYLSAFNGGPHLKDRVGQGVRDDNAEIRIENLALSILGGIQPDRLAKLRDLTSDGLLQRFLVVLMAAAQRGSQKHPVQAEEVEFTKLLDSVHTKQATNYSFALDAEPILDRVLDHLHDLEQVKGFSSALIGAIGKFKGYYARLALVLQVGKEESASIRNQPSPSRGIISKQTAEHAEELLLKFLLPHTFGLYDVIANGGDDRDTIRAIGDFILATDKTRLRPSDLTGGVRRLRSLPADKVAEWASRFVALGWLQPEASNSVHPKAWLVEPSLRGYFATRRLQAQRARSAAHEILKAGGTRG